MQYDLWPYLQVLASAIPQMKLPLSQYGVIGGYGYFDLKLRKDISSYAALRSDVFQLVSVNRSLHVPCVGFARRPCV